MNADARRKWQVAAGAVAILWLALGGLVIPLIIEGAYRGESLPVLNDLLEGRAEHPLEFYLGRWRPWFLLGLLITGGILLPASFLSLPTLRSKWNRYWFRPTALGYLATARILCVSMQLWLLASKDYYNLEHIRELSSLPDVLYDPLPALQLFLWPWGADFRPSLDTMVAIYWGTMAVGGVALIGFRTRLSLLIFAMGVTVLQAFYYSFGDMHHPEALMVFALWFFALGPAGRALSLDDCLVNGFNVSRIAARAKETSIYAGWSILLMQCLIVLVYFDSAIKKLATGGLDWMNGYTLQYYLFHDALLRGSELGVWLGSQHFLVQLLSGISIFFEGTFWIVLFHPRLAWLYVPLGLGFHIGCCVTGIACFYQFMALYIVFLPHLLGHWTRTPLDAWRIPVGKRKDERAAA